MPSPDPVVLERRGDTIEAVPETEVLPLTFQIRQLSVWYGQKRAIDSVNMDIPSNAVTSIIGPSGCGKSTFLRCLNRMHELVPRTCMDGKVLLLGQDLYSADVDPAIVRRRIGMVFQKSNPFPTMSIGENVIIGLRLNGVRDHKFRCGWQHCGTRSKMTCTNPAQVCPADNSSVSALRVLSRLSRKSFSWMSPARRWIPSPLRRSKS